MFPKSSVCFTLTAHLNLDQSRCMCSKATRGQCLPCWAALHRSARWALRSDQLGEITEMFTLLTFRWDPQLPDSDQHDPSFGSYVWQFLRLTLRGLVHPDLPVLVSFDHCVRSHRVGHRKVSMRSVHLATFPCCWPRSFVPGRIKVSGQQDSFT